MRNIFVLIIAAFAFLPTLSASITQDKADDIVLERMDKETRPYVVYAKGEAQKTGMSLTTDAGEVIEWEYPCRVYYVYYFDLAGASAKNDVIWGRYLIIKEEDGNLLEVNVTKDGGPADLAGWRVVTNDIEPVLTLKQDEFIVPFKNQTVRIPIKLGRYPARYKVSCGDSWVTWDEKASSKDTIVLKLADNDASDFPRATAVTINSANLQEKVELFQYGTPNPRIGDDTSADVLAFPGAEGGGRFTTGGRGGKVYHVTRLDDYAAGATPIPGTLRYAVEKRNEKRIIVFDISGNIELVRGLGIGSGDVSLIGQTAPGDGVTIKNCGFALNDGLENFVIRFLRVRAGDKFGEVDALTGRDLHGGIIDHISASYGVDENTSFYGANDFTFQWSLSSESLNQSVHQKGAHGYGGLWGGKNASFHHVLMAQHDSRTPRLVGSLDALIDLRNNVYYNWGPNLGCYGAAAGKYNFVNNVYKPGPATNRKYQIAGRIVLAGYDEPLDTYPLLWIKGNRFDYSSPYLSERPIAMAKASDLNNLEGLHVDETPPYQAKKDYLADKEFEVQRTITHTADVGYERVLTYAGASLRRDTVDKRVVREVREGSYTYIGERTGIPGLIDGIANAGGVKAAYPALKSLPALADTDGDGIPDIWEDAYGLDKNNPEDAGLYNLDPLKRYSNLEVYFHNLVQHIVYEQNLGGTYTH